MNNYKKDQIDKKKLSCNSGHDRGIVHEHDEDVDGRPGDIPVGYGQHGRHRPFLPSVNSVS